jgi:hypothetical protein
VLQLFDLRSPSRTAARPLRRSTNEQREAVNAPVNVTGNAKTHSYRLRLKGRRRESDPVPVVLREREVELFSGITTVVRL